MALIVVVAVFIIYSFMFGMGEGFGSAPYGSPCNGNDDCTTGYCADGYCFNSVAPLPPGFKLDNPNLVYNPKGPKWKQQTINAAIINTAIACDLKFNVGKDPQIPFAITCTNKEWQSTVAYNTGDVVTYNGGMYMNLAWNADKRGAGFSVNKNQNPEKDGYAWLPVHF